MDEVLSDYAAVSPALQHAHTDKMTAGTSEQPENENGRSEVLHVGCGTYHSEKLPLMFRMAGWREIRLDIDPAVRVCTGSSCVSCKSSHHEAD
jgi:hypothetical protein